MRAFMHACSRNPNPSSPLPPLATYTQEEEGEAAYVSAVEGPLPAALKAPLGGKAEKCDEFVNRAMQEMGNINICESDGWLPGCCRVVNVHACDCACYRLAGCHALQPCLWLHGCGRNILQVGRSGACTGS